MFQKIEGSWGLAGVVACDENAQDIRFSGSGDYMYVTYRDPIPSVQGMEQFFRYRVLGSAGSAVRMELEGETRTTEAGASVVWDLVLVNSDAFCWHRTDWELGACTPQEHRCSSSIEDAIHELRILTADVLHRLERGDLESVAGLFALPDALPADEIGPERARLTRALSVVAREFGPPLDPTEANQMVQSPQLSEIAISALGQSFRRDVMEYRFLLFSTRYGRLGDGFFRIEFARGGRIVGMTFSLPVAEANRVAEVASMLANEATP